MTQIPIPFSSSLRSLTLNVTNGTAPNQVTHTQTITSVFQGNNSFPITNANILTAFNNNPAGTIFTPSIVTSYGSDELGNALSIVSTPSVSNFVPRQITPNLSLADIPNKLTTDSSFSLSVTTNSTGVLSYSSSAPSVATVNTTTGLVTLVGAGTTTITVNLAASANGVYTAATASRQLVVSVPAAPTIQRGFSVLTDNSDFASLDFDSDMTTLFTGQDEFISGITMPNSNFTFNSAAYATLYLSSNGWLSFGTNVSESNYGGNNQQPINTFRFFARDLMSSGSYKFISNNTRLLIKLTGYIYGYTTNTFTIKVIIEQSGEIRINYTLAFTFASNKITIGFVGDNSSGTSDDIFLILNGATFNGTFITLDLYSLLNGKTILFIK